MTTCWKGLALMAAGLVLGGTARAQHQVQPTPFGPARTPEPAPIAPSQTPPLMPGPITPLDVPPGPPACLTLPADHTGAFQSCNFPPEQAVFFHVGAQGLNRQGLRTFDVAFVNDGPLDTGAPLPLNLNRVPSVLNLNEIDPEMAWGVRGTLGYLFNSHIGEFTFFYLYDKADQAFAIRPGRLSVPFFNPPVGFEGNNGLFLQADRVLARLTSKLWNAEFNYRYSNLAVTECEVILGLRYVDQSDLLDIIVDDDGRTNVDVNGFADPTRIALYSARTNNRIVAPQLGFEYHKQVFKWFSCGMNAKGAWGVNFAETRYHLQRGDGLLGFERTETDPVFSHLYEVGFFAEFHILERLRLRGGYNLLWLLQVATADRQINFDLSAPAGTGLNHDGSIFYHGPMVELQFLF